MIRSTRLAILVIDDHIIAMSEDINDINQYISQFKYYFESNSNYKIVFENSLSSNSIRMYGEYYLHPFTDEIILTDREIKYYHTLFSKLYEDTKTMMSQALLSNSIMRLTEDEKRINRKMFDMLHTKVYSYQSFLDNLETEVILSKYIINPLSIEEDILYNE